MPIYEYTCTTCGQQFDHLAKSMHATTAIACPKCASTQTKRALSVFAVAADGAKSSDAGAEPMCGRCGGPGPCGMN